MKTIAIFGANRGLGLAMVKHYVQQNYSVIAMVRNPEKATELAELNVKIIQCDAVNQADVQYAVSCLPKDAIVISGMGSFQAQQSVDYIGHRYLIDALEEQEIQRFLMVTSLGCGDSWSMLSDRAKAVFGGAVREKSLAESWLQTSQLAYTIVRPGGLKDGESTGNAEIYQDEEVHGLINRSDVAVITERLLNDDTSIGQIYASVDPTLSY
jgi:putative NADH-flavin reductase